MTLRQIYSCPALPHSQERKYRYFYLELTWILILLNSYQWLFLMHFHQCQLYQQCHQTSPAHSETNKSTFGQISRIKYFNKQASVWPVFNCIHDLVTINARNEHTVQKKPVILPDLSFVEMRLSNHVRGVSNFNQISWWALFFPEKKQTKSAGWNFNKHPQTCLSLHAGFSWRNTEAGQAGR